jgi:hypothetical protein
MCRGEQRRAEENQRTGASERFSVFFIIHQVWKKNEQGR